MSVRSEESPAPGLRSDDGELVSVHISLPPRKLEKLLEALAELSFPVNPQIYHQAAIGYVHINGREEIEAAARVEFPAFSSHLDEVRQALDAAGLPADGVHVRDMVENLHSDHDEVAAPEGAGYVKVRYYRQRP